MPVKVIIEKHTFYDGYEFIKTKRLFLLPKFFATTRRGIYPTKPVLKAFVLLCNISQ
jgi:hypothetical protein